MAFTSLRPPSSCCTVSCGAFLWPSPQSGCFMSIPAASPCANVSTVFLPSPPPSFRVSPSSSSLCYRKEYVSGVYAISPGFYKIPIYPGVPVGSTLKLYNMPYNVDPQAVIDHFTATGATVESLEIENNEEENNAHGVITLGDLDQACVAVAQLDAAKFQGKCLRMDFVTKRPYDPEPPRRSRMNRSYGSSSSSNGGGTRNYGGSASASANRIYVGNMPWRIDDTSLGQLFSAHGTVQEARVMKEADSGRSRGFGFVVMSTPAEVEKAIAALDGTEVEGRRLRVSVASG